MPYVALDNQGLPVSNMVIRLVTIDTRNVTRQLANSSFGAYIVTSVAAVAVMLGSTACSNAESGAGCDYVEASDVTNNTNVGGTAEDIRLTLGASSLVVCGEGNSGHFDTEDLDWDAYTLDVGAGGNAVLMLTATDPPSLSLFDVTVLTGSLHALGTATLVRSASVQLAAGKHVIEVRVQNPTPLSSSFSYRITLMPMP